MSGQHDPMKDYIAGASGDWRARDSSIAGVMGYNDHQAREEAERKKAAERFKGPQILASAPSPGRAREQGGFIYGLAHLSVVVALAFGGMGIAANANPAQPNLIYGLAGAAVAYAVLRATGILKILVGLAQVVIVAAIVIGGFWVVGQFAEKRQAKQSGAVVFVPAPATGQPSPAPPPAAPR
jgi:hypothetical protein